MIIGAAGSIGRSVVKILLEFFPQAITLVDISENNLVELVRDLRSSTNINIPEDFNALPICYGSQEFTNFIESQLPFDYLFNLAALKHVRSEKNIYSIQRMIDVNIIFLYKILTNKRLSFKNVFSVSSDKAVNSANIMGATKKIMENILYSCSEVQSFTSARFANVAFSDGSLPFGFLNRIEKKQPIVAPVDIRRYFISHREAESYVYYLEY